MSTQIQITPASGITIGTTPITSGTDGRILFQSGGVVQQSANFTFDGTLGLLVGNNTVGFVKTSTQNISGANVGELTNYSLNNFPLVKLSGTDLSTYFSGRIGLYHGNTEKAYLKASSLGGEIGGFNALFLQAKGALSTDISLRVRNSANTRTNLQVDGTGQVRTRNNSFSGDLFLVSYVSDVGVERDSFRFSHYPQNSMGRAWTFDAGFNGNNEGLRIYNDLAGADQGVLSLRQNNLLVGYDAFIPTVADRKTIVLFNGVAPTASHADSVKFYSADIVAGNAAPHFRTENGNIIKLYQQSSAGILTVPQLVTVLQNLGLLS